MNAPLKFVLSVLVFTGFAGGGAIRAQSYPTKPVRIIVPASAGSGIDAVARMIGQKMSENWGQPVVVDNRPGGTGTLAAVAVAAAAPDGYTLLASGSAFLVSAALQLKLPYDPLKDFAGAAQIRYGSSALVATPALGAKSVKDLIALAKAQPGKIIFASGPVGGGGHLTGARFNLAAGIKVVTVAFKGSAEATIEVVAGRTHYSLGPLPPALPFIKDGKLLALAVIMPQRLPLLPDVPALAETLPDFKRNDTSDGLLAPAKTPRPILNQISKEVARILDLVDIKERLASMGVVPAHSTPDEYDKILRYQIETLSKVARDAGLRGK
jgi:tripartite-type tricarboxylate transporter receptor subunit TctC